MIKQKIFPSVMAKNQQELNAILKNVSGVATYLHLDVADGKFVPSTPLWFPFKLSKKFKYIAHLMVKDPEKWIQKHEEKVEFCIVHAEALKDISTYIHNTKSKKKKVAIALNSETKVSKIKLHLQFIDYVLLLTVHPGFYGAKYLRAPLKKIAEIKKINPKTKVFVDGGMNQTTEKEARKAGADYIVSGSFITKAEKPKERMKILERNF